MTVVILIGLLCTGVTGVFVLVAWYLGVTTIGGVPTLGIGLVMLMTAVGLWVARLQRVPLSVQQRRSAFISHLERVLAKGNSGALLLLDIDHFTQLNCCVGYRKADAILFEVAALLHQHLEPWEEVYRIGGDSFGLVLPGSDAQQALSVAEELLATIRSRTLPVGSCGAILTASAGVALFPEHGTDPERLLLCGEMAVGRARADGGNQCWFYHADDDPRRRAQRQLEWEGRIRQALEENRFLLFCQPIMQVATRTVGHYELLLRMVGEDRQIHLPGLFLPVAEESGLIRETDRWVLRRALGLLAVLQRSGEGVELQVNLSPRTLSDPQLPAIFRETVAATGADPSGLVIEITETADICRHKEALRTLRQLRAEGCKLALDDFGAGFTSFRELKVLPVDYIKIDSSFVRNILTDPSDQRFVQTVVGLAHDLGRRVVAEGVTDEQTLDLLAQYGVDLVQGYHIGLPVDVADQFHRAALVQVKGLPV